MGKAGKLIDRPSAGVRKSAPMGREQSFTTRFRRSALCATLAALALFPACGGSLYKVKPKVDTPVTDGKDAGAGGFRLRAAPLVTDEESQELFEANLPLAGLLPVRVEIRNESGSPITFKRVRFHLRDAEGREWKFRSPKQAVSRILKADEVYLYNPNSRKRFEEGVREYSLDLETPLDSGNQRRGLIFFQTPKKEPVENSRGLVLTVEGLPQPVEVIFN